MACCGSEHSSFSPAGASTKRHGVQDRGQCVRRGSDADVSVVECRNRLERLALASRTTARSRPQYTVRTHFRSRSSISCAPPQFFLSEQTRRHDARRSSTVARRATPLLERRAGLVTVVQASGSMPRLSSLAARPLREMPRMRAASDLFPFARRRARPIAVRSATSRAA